MASTMYYSGLRLDRAAAAREDPQWVAGVLGEDSTTVIPLWRDKCLVRDGLPVTTRRGDAEDLLAAADGLFFLGLDGGSAVFVADVSALEQPDALVLAGAQAVMDIRALVSAVPPVAAGTFAYARGIAHWPQPAVLRCLRGPDGRAECWPSPDMPQLRQSAIPPH
jgi:NAD+ diphosphatase